MDPVTLQQMMRGMAPIESPYFDEPITDENAVDVLMVESYLGKFENTAKQNVFLVDLIDRFWRQLNTDPGSAETMAGVAEAVRTGHLKFFSDISEDQDALSFLNASGGLPEDPNVQMIFHNNYSGNKVDYYLRRKVETLIELNPDGTTRHTTRVTLKNTAPDGPPSVLLGPPSDLADDLGDPPGLNRMILNFLLPEGAIPRTLTIDDKRTDPFTFDEEEHVVAWDIFEIPAGETVAATLISEGFANISRSGVYTINLHPQSLVEPERFELQVEAPEGFLFQEPKTVSAEASDVFTLSGRLDETLTVKLQLVPL